jgi:hypothetical protein
LDYHGLNLSSDSLLLALHDKDKSIQVRELRQISSLLTRISVADSISQMRFTPDNKYLVCAS